MPELPEVETVRRMLEAIVAGRMIRTVRLSGLALREPVSRTLPARLAGRRIDSVRRRGKFLLIDLDRGLTLISHLGMSGRWLFFAKDVAGEPGRHVHARLQLSAGAQLWFEDPRRFGLLRLARTDRLSRERSLADLGPDPLNDLPTPERLREVAKGVRSNIKSFLLDQRRLAGIGNIYASEILHRASVDPRLAAGRLTLPEWSAVARETPLVLGESIARMGTTFSMYRTLSGEPGDFAEQLRVYDREGEPCRVCATPVRRIVQAQRSTYFCPRCQSRAARAPARIRPRR
jgi:formamidopyrimidine-DNA glycosylase